MSKTQEEFKQRFEATTSKYQELTEDELKQVTGGDSENFNSDGCIQCIDRAISIINDALPSANEVETAIFNIMLEDLGVIKSSINQKSYSLAKYYSDGICDNFVLLANKPAFLSDALDGIKSYLLNI